MPLSQWSTSPKSLMAASIAVAIAGGVMMTWGGMPYVGGIVTALGSAIFIGVGLDRCLASAPQQEHPLPLKVELQFPLLQEKDCNDSPRIWEVMGGSRDSVPSSEETVLTV